MPILELISGVRFINIEYIRTFNKDLLLIHFYANKPTDVDPKYNITYEHYSAIIKFNMMEEDQIKYMHTKLNPQVLDGHVLSLISLVDQINHHLGILKSSGLKYDDHQKNTYMLEALKESIPNITEEELLEGYQLSIYLEMLKGGIIYEKTSLDDLLQRYRNVPENIRQEFNVGIL